MVFEWSGIYQNSKRGGKKNSNNRNGNDEYAANSGENCFSACTRFGNESGYVVWKTAQIVEFCLTR